MRAFENDAEQLGDFLDSLDDKERSIIEDTNDVQVILRIKKRIQDDVDGTAKDLAMED